MNDNDNLYVSASNYSTISYLGTTNYDGSATLKYPTDWKICYESNVVEDLKKENKELRKSLAYLASTVNDLIIEVKKLKHENSVKQN